MQKLDEFVWGRAVNNTPQPSNLHIKPALKTIPSRMAILKLFGECSYFFQKSGGQPREIAIWPNSIYDASTCARKAKQIRQLHRRLQVFVISWRNIPNRRESCINIYMYIIYIFMCISYILHVFSVRQSKLFTFPQSKFLKQGHHISRLWPSNHHNRK